MWLLSFVPMFSVPIHLKPYIYHYSFARKENVLYTVCFYRNVEHGTDIKQSTLFRFSKSLAILGFLKSYQE